jgi:predicted pyridoxine 5'-phosphate oxidase superfamily flavin-nucleotide-binding protein
MSPTSRFHDGELQVQQRAGLSDVARQVGRIVQNSIPPVAQEFLRDQPMAIVGGSDPQGRIWASVLFGAPGFVQALDPRTVRVAALPDSEDPLAEILGIGARLGMLAIQPSTRSRMRLNGTVVTIEPDGFEMVTQEVFSNCQKYIQRREIGGDLESTNGESQLHAGQVLTAEQTAWLGTSDTFFIASAHPERGADVSHRGGLPGFVRVLAPTSLVFPDYKGNAMFQTLGNIATRPEAGLLFLDFDGGRTLQLTGRAELLWDDAASAYAPDTGRAVRFEIDGVRERYGIAVPRASFIDYSPFNPPVPVE